MILQEYLIDNIDTSFIDASLIPFAIHKKEIKKGEVITPLNAIENKAYFINQGIVEMSIPYLDDEKIIDFYFEGDFFSSYASFLEESLSQVKITALTDVSVEFVVKDDLRKAYQNSLLANKIGRLVTEKLYLKKFRRETNFLVNTAERNYLDLLERDKKIIENISVIKIAKYLGIQPESLSRIRKSIIS